MKYYPTFWAMSFYFAWGNGRKASTVFEDVARFRNTRALINYMLHPVVQVKGLVRNIVEDTEMAWVFPMLVEPLVHTVRARRGL